MKTEYIVWGIAPGDTEESILFTKAQTQEQAQKVCETLKVKHGCNHCRVQVLNFNETPDFIQTLITH